MRDKQLRTLGTSYRYAPVFTTVPGVAWGARLHHRVGGRRHQRVLEPVHDPDRPDPWPHDPADVPPEPEGDPSFLVVADGELPTGS